MVHKKKKKQTNKKDTQMHAHKHTWEHKENNFAHYTIPNQVSPQEKKERKTGLESCRYSQ